MTTLNYEQWVEKYRPLLNPITEDNSYGNTALETFGEELNFVKSFDNNRIWTLKECTDEEMWIIPGYCVVDRYLYFVTEVPWENENIQVNDNEMVSLEDAKIACIDFFKTFDVNFTLDEVSDYFNLRKDETFKDEMTTVHAKYLAIGLYENKFNEFPQSMEDLIHNYYSQL